MINTILVINFGSQHYDRIISLLNKFEYITHKIIHWKEFDKLLLSTNNNFNGVIGIILSGSPEHLYDDNCPIVSNKIFDLGIPILGICYGMQYIIKMFGGKVSKMTQGGEFGNYEIQLLTKESKLFYELGSKLIVHMRHYDMVSNIPSKFKILGHTESCIAIIEYENAETNEFIYGLQFHPEVDDNQFGFGEIIFRNFLDICFNVMQVNVIKGKFNKK